MTGIRAVPGCAGDALPSCGGAVCPGGRRGEAAEAEGVGEDEDGGERHGAGGEGGREEEAGGGPERAGGERDQGGVVGEGPEEVLADVEIGRASCRERGWMSVVAGTVEIKKTWV